MRDMKFKYLLLLASVFFCSMAHAREYIGLGPISTRNQNPVYLQNLSLTPMRAETLPEGMIELRMDSAYSNMYERGANTNADLDLDMELWRLSPTVTYGLTHDLEIGVEIPLIHTNGGFLDAFIQRFHKFFGFPNGGRNNVENGLFAYRFDAGGVQRFNYAETPMDLGDIVFHLKQQMTGEDSDWPAISWFADIKLPTGKQSKGVGSGAPDFGFGMAVEASYKRLHGYCNVGYYVLGGNDMIVDYMRDIMLAYTVAGEFTILPAWSLIVQLDGSTPLLDNTGLDSWDGVPLDLVVGLRGEESKMFGGPDFIWQVGFSEDVTSKGPSVDFSVFISLGLKFDLAGRTRPAGDWMAKKTNSKF